MARQLEVAITHAYNKGPIGFEDNLYSLVVMMGMGTVIPVLMIYLVSVVQFE